MAARAEAGRAAAAAVTGAGAPLAGAARLGAAAPGGCSRCSSQPLSQACPPWLSPVQALVTLQASQNKGVAAQLLQLLLLWLANRRSEGVEHPAQISHTCAFQTAASGWSAYRQKGSTASLRASGLIAAALLLSAALMGGRLRTPATLLALGAQCSHLSTISTQTSMLWWRYR